MTIKIIRLDYSAQELRYLSRKSSDGDQARRLLALAAILDGFSREQAGKLAGMERQTLRDWVHRYNAEGVDGLTDRPRSGRKPLLEQDRLIEFDKIVETPPDPLKDGVVRWRCVDLKGQIEKRFGVEISERSVGRLLNVRGFRRLSVRPQHPKADEALQQTSKLTFRPL